MNTTTNPKRKAMVFTILLLFTAFANTAVSQCTVNILNTTDVSCYGLANGAITVQGANGTAPYTYLWNTGAADSTITGLAAGIYTVSVTDNIACVATTTVSITQPISISISILSYSVNCNGGNDGNATAVVSGGTPSYLYNWSNGASTNVASGLSAGIYTVQVSDYNGCISSQTVSINQPATALTSTITSVNVGCYGSGSGSASAIVYGGTPPYMYQWNNGATSNTITGLVAGVYTVTVSDASGCITISSIAITQPAPLVLSDSTIPAGCGNNNGSIITNYVSGGTLPLVYSWSNGATGTAVNNLISGNYALQITDAVGCNYNFTYALPDSCGGSNTVVWPGDCNYDLTANNMDFLNIAMAYGSTGATRAGANISWTAQPMADWGTISYLTDDKHSDSNGDGIVDNNDTLAIVTNYGATHPYKTTPVHPYTVGAAELSIVASLDSSFMQQNVRFDIMLGNSNTIVDSIYALAYTINFQSNLVKTYNGISYINSWFGTPGTDLFSIQKSFAPNGYVDAGVGGNNHLNRSGQGKIGECHLVTTDNLSGIAQLNVSLSNVVAITKGGNHIPLNVKGDSLIIKPQYSSIYTMGKSNVSIYPNPSNGEFMISSDNNIDAVYVTNIIGEEVMKLEKLNNNHVKMDIKELKSGTYLIIIRNINQQTTIQRLHIR